MTRAQPLVEAMTLLVREHSAVAKCHGLRSWATRANERGLLGAEDALAWPDAIDRAVASGRFHAVTFFLAAGTRPPTSADRA